jgi:sugar lactone lactonase YvrE
VAVDPSGNLYVADRNNGRILKRSATDGSISTYAGSGSSGYSGDNGPATSAQLNNPHGLALDTSGNLYIADTNNHRIRKVATDGTISTVAGDGTGLFSGDGGPATAAELRRPYGVAVDGAGNLYISDSENYRIRKVNAATQSISTIAGTGSSGYTGDDGAAASAPLCGPRGIRVDSAGNLYFADINLSDPNASRIRMISASTGIITRLAGSAVGYFGDGGLPPGAMLYYPMSLALGPSGELYIADQQNNRVRWMPLD